jgi:hypothetical protein
MLLKNISKVGANNLKVININLYITICINILFRLSNIELFQAVSTAL